MIAEPGGMWGTAALVRWNMAPMLSRNVWSHSSSLISSRLSRLIW